MTRFLDVVFSLIGLILGAPLLALLLLGGWIDTRSPLLFQRRVGRFEEPFVLVKFRTMKPNAAWLPTHLVDSSAVTPYGRLLRRFKLDELPQLWNVLKGEMSLVGPRPSLESQLEVIHARRTMDVFSHRPGITGLAQTQGIDMSEPQRLAEADAEMLRVLIVKTYLSLIFATLSGAGRGDRVR